MQNGDLTTQCGEHAERACEPFSPIEAPHAGGLPLARRGSFLAVLARATDQRLASLIGCVLFVLAAWPLALVDLPPFQDLPNHLASVVVMDHPDRYPDFVFNGFLKTNSALFVWLVVVGHAVGLKAAARLFVLGVLGLGAFALPRFVLAFGGRRRMVVSAFFAWPLVHHWFVSMGMLDFSLAFPLSMLLLVLLDAQRRRPTVARAFGIGLFCLAIWYAHVFPLLVVYLLVGLHVVTRSTWRTRADALVSLGVPLAPSALVAAVSLWAQTNDPTGPMTGYIAGNRYYSPLWELFYNLWAECLWSFTWFEIATLVPCLAMGVWAIFRWRDDVPFLGPVALVTLAVLFFFSPYGATNWAYLNSRFIPFLWLAALVRLPESLSAWSRSVLAGCAVSYSAGMGADYVRLGGEWSRFTAGVSEVPEGARLLPLLFRSKQTSENTRSLLHAWGLYVVERQTSAPLLFAHSRSFPVMYRSPPAAQFNHLVLEGFASSMRSPEWMCETMRYGGVVLDDCPGAWRAQWAAFWRSAEPEFDHVLMWSAPDSVLRLVPSDYRLVFRRDELAIFARVPSAAAATP